MRNVRRAVFVLLLTAISTLAASRAFAQDAVITIVNRSSFDIHELYLSPVDVDEWGPDQLGEEIIESGGKFQLYGIDCDVYDIMIVDEDGDECVLEVVELCDEEAKWVITNDELLSCQGWQ